VKNNNTETMRKNNNILKRVQGLPVEVIRKVKNFLEYSIQIDLIQNTAYKYVEINKTINERFIHTYVKEPSMEALMCGMQEKPVQVVFPYTNRMGEEKLKKKYTEYTLPGHFIQNLYDSTIDKPLRKALKVVEENAPYVVDFGITKRCITPLEVSLLKRLRELEAPLIPNYENERVMNRYRRYRNNYYRTINGRIYNFITQLHKCKSFISYFDKAIESSIFNFLKGLAILSKKYTIQKLYKKLGDQTEEDMEIDVDRFAFYEKNRELSQINNELDRMAYEEEITKTFLRKEAKIQRKQEKEQKKIIRQQTKIEKENLRIQKEKEKALRAVLRKEAQAKKLKEKNEKMEQKKQKEAELVEKFTYKTLRRLFV
jgi:hypothetical protein